MKAGELKVVIASLGVMAFTLQGCGKYEDGPMFSVRSKTKRLVGEWYIASTSIFGSTEIIYEFEADGDFKITQTIESLFSYYDESVEYKSEGEWEWEDGKESIFVTLEDEDGDVQEQVFEIKRLTKDELSLAVPYYFTTRTYEFEKKQ